MQEVQEISLNYHKDHLKIFFLFYLFMLLIFFISQVRSVETKMYLRLMVLVCVTLGVFHANQGMK